MLIGWFQICLDESLCFGASKSQLLLLVNIKKKKKKKKTLLKLGTIPFNTYFFKGAHSTFAELVILLIDVG